MKIFEYQNQRFLSGDRFQRFANLAHHSFTRSADDLVVQRLPVVHFHQMWELNEPGRRKVSQSVHDRTLLGVASQLTERFQHWIVGFFTTETLDTLPASNSYVHSVDGLLMKHVNKRGFSDTSLAGDEYQLPLPAQRFIERNVEFGERRLAAHHSGFCVGWQTRRSSALLDHRSDELIASPGNSLDKKWFVVPVSQHLSDCQNVLLHDFLVHISVGP